LQRIIRLADKIQQKYAVFGFPYAVVKKYRDDSGGYQAALLTYYGFLSIFPLLLVGFTALRLLFHHYPAVQQQVASGISHFFPLLGQDLQSNIGRTGKNGIGLAVSVVITLFGARGAADALRFTLNNMWQVPRDKRSGFPKSVFQGFHILGLGFLGFAATVAVSVFTSSLGHALWVKVLANASGFLIAGILLMFVFRTATVKKVGLKDVAVGAFVAAAFLQLLLTFGGILLAHQLKNFSSLYGSFAIVLGLLFWLYLLAQAVVHSAEIDTVRYFHLYPRSLSGQLETAADRRAYTLYAKAQRHEPLEKQKIEVRFPGSNENGK
jgi:membrane protein